MPKESDSEGQQDQRSKHGGFAATSASATRNSDPEGIHQMRVGLCRLRAKISLFKTLV